MNLKAPKKFGKLRWVQYADVAGTLRDQRRALWPYLLVCLFGAVVSGLLAFSCIAYDRSWSDWLIAAFMTFGTALCLHTYLPMLNRVQVGLVCDRGVGYAWLRSDGSAARELWYAFKPETELREWRGRDGRTWKMRDRHSLAFRDGRMKGFIAMYLVDFSDDSDREFMVQASRAYHIWMNRYRRIGRADG